jgi:soluble lytic murein transglycosylase-like protein
MRHQLESQTAGRPWVIKLLTLIAVLVSVISMPSIVVETSRVPEAKVTNPLPAISQATGEPLPLWSSQAASPAELERAVTRAAQQHHLHPALLFAVMKAESSFNPIVVSKAGAVGLMQLVPETAMRHGVRNLYDTNENVAGGARHLRYLLDRFHGNTRLALAAYNAGERKVDRYKQIPPYKETQHYVQKVLSYYRVYRKEASLLPLRGDHQEGYRVRTL